MENTKIFQLPIYLNDETYSIHIEAKNKKMADRSARKFHRHVFKKKSILYNQLLMIDVNVFLHFAEPDRYKKNLLKKYGITIPQDTAVAMVNAIREINKDIELHGGKKKKILAMTLFPIYKFGQDTKNIALDSLDIVSEVYSTGKDTYDSEIKQDDYIEISTSFNANLDSLFLLRFLTNFLLLVIFLMVIFMNLHPIAKLFSSFFAVLLMVVNIMPWLIKLLANQPEVKPSQKPFETEKE